MRSSFRYLIAATSLVTFYLIYVNLLDIQSSWKPASWPSFRHSHTSSAVRPQTTVIYDTKLPEEEETRVSTISPSPDALTSLATSPDAFTSSASSSLSTQTSSVSPQVVTFSTQTSTLSAQTLGVEPTNTTPLEPSQTPLSKVIVMAKLEKEDTSWVEEHLPDWQRAIYTVDNLNATLHTSRNKGREANAYLLYLIQHYSSLPNIIVFLHPHRDGYPGGWHTDAPNYDNVASVQSLRLPFVQENGYANLRCNPAVGCPNEIQTERETPIHMDLVYKEAYKEMFGMSANVPKVVGVACCSQFAVSREQVLQRPKSDYETYLKWLMDTTEDDGVSGRVFEYLWHIMFGKEPV